MFVSVIVCTYRRSEDLQNLLSCLAAQTYQNFEVLVVDGSGADRTVRYTVDSFLTLHRSLRLGYIASRKGLTRQRNIGLRQASGDVICFLDDDVTFDRDFLHKSVELLQRPEMRDVGGMSGRDLRRPPLRMSFAWWLKRALGIIPSLNPGEVDHLGRKVPLILSSSVEGSIRVGYLTGFCMIYRREAIVNAYFDEGLPTWGGEDRDFSMEVGKRWRLLRCGRLALEHHRSPQSRDEYAERAFQHGFGMGRSFAKRAQNLTDYITVAHYVVGEIVFGILLCMRAPSLYNWRTALAKPRGTIAGLRSLRSSPSIR